MWGFNHRYNKQDVFLEKSTEANEELNLNDLIGCQLYRRSLFSGKWIFEVYLTHRDMIIFIEKTFSWHPFHTTKSTLKELEKQWDLLLCELRHRQESWVE